MDNQTFIKEKSVLNRLYFDVFGDIPCIQDFSCSREEYIDAMKRAIDTNQKIDTLLPKVGNPIIGEFLT